MWKVTFIYPRRWVTLFLKIVILKLRLKFQFGSAKRAWTLLLGGLGFGPMLWNSYFLEILLPRCFVLCFYKFWSLIMWGWNLGCIQFYCLAQDQNIMARLDICTLYSTLWNPLFCMCQGFTTCNFHSNETINLVYWNLRFSLLAYVCLFRVIWGGRDKSLN